MIVIGIDVSKETMVGVALNKGFKVVESFTFKNTQEEITHWLEVIYLKYPHLMIASEATAEYHRVLALSCISAGIPFKLLNPIVTKQFTRSTVRKRKTDPQDALTIAKLAATGEGRLVTTQTFSPLKTYERSAVKLKQMQLKLHQIQEHLSQVAPEDQQIQQALNINMNQLETSVSLLREKTQGSIEESQFNLLMSIPGIGKTIAPILIAEIGDINQFKSGQALIAFSGFDPRVKQSGKGLHHNTHLTKRGSPYLRHALFVSASIAQRYDEQLKAYYVKKRDEGKQYKEATIAVARKLLYRVYAVLKRQTPYLP